MFALRTVFLIAPAEIFLRVAPDIPPYLREVNILIFFLFIGGEYRFLIVVLIKFFRNYYPAHIRNFVRAGRKGDVVIIGVALYVAGTL